MGVVSKALSDDCFNGVSVLDCTLRDGGLAIEEAMQTNSVDGFSEKEIKNIYGFLLQSNVDIIEVGIIRNNSLTNRMCSVFPNLNSISELYHDKNMEAARTAVFFQGPDLCVERIPEWNVNYPQIARVGLRYSELDRSLDYCRSLAKKGYSVSIQPIVTIRYTQDEIRQICDLANEIGAFSVYIVDSYGSMNDIKMMYYFDLLSEGLDKQIKIGLHCHTNSGQDFVNTKELICRHDKREIILDGCCLGLGQGAGNLRTEMLINNLNAIGCEKYDFCNVLKVCDSLDRFVAKGWGTYSPDGLISARYGMAYKYAYKLRQEFSYSYHEINKILSGADEKIKYRYTDDNLRKLLKEYSESS